MAKEIIEKKNYAKHLPRVGSTVAVAMAMTVALSTQANASELNEGVLLDDIPPIDSGSTLENPLTLSLTTPANNETIAQNNNTTLDENQQTDDTNQQTGQGNSNTGAQNETLSEGALPDPSQDLPDVPDAPDVPNTEGLDEEGYNDAIGGYNDAVDGYNDDVDNYNNAVDDYNGNVTDYNQQLKDSYDSAVIDYTGKETDHQLKQQAYQDYLNSQEYADYLTQKSAFEAAWTNYENQLAALTPEQRQYLEDPTKFEEANAKYQQYLIDKQAYDEALKNHQAKEAAYKDETKIYNEVSQYNKDISDKNNDYSDLNNALNNNLDTGSATDIDNVGSLNSNLTIDPDIINTLKSYNDLTGMQSDLEKAAADLDKHPGKGKALGSAEYAEYLKAVQDFNDAVTAHNKNVDAYNAAVQKYNEAVDSYNKTTDPSSTTDSGISQGTQGIDWGNINITGNLNHIDVKYTAAASKDVTVDAQGNKTYSDNVTQYTVTGVYPSEAAAKQSPNSYGVSYTTSSSDTTIKIQHQKKDNANNEFGSYDPRTGKTHTGASINPATGTVSFYVTLKDSEGNVHDINVSLNAASVYAPGSYYKPEANDFLKDFVGKDNKKLPTEKIGNDTYYDISGQSVFLISALTCDGMTNWWGLTPNGLDLILNMQTMIQNHQANNATTINYQGYLLGKTAQASKPTAPVYTGPEDPGHMDPPIMPNLTKPTLKKPEYKGPEDPGEFTETPPADPTYATHLSHINKLDKLDEKIIAVIPPVDPGYTPVWFNDNIPIAQVEEIPEEEVALAAVPKTGDITGLFAAMSLFSAGGLMFLRKKGKYER